VEVTDDHVEENLSRVRSLLVFSVEHKGPKIDSRSGVKKSDVMSERWKAMFTKNDTEGTGILSVDNIRRMIRRDLKISERLVADQAINDLFNAIDEDGGGAVEFNEFLDFVQQPSTRGTISNEDIFNSVVRGVRLALHRNKIRVSELEANFRNFEESTDISIGELGPNDMVRFFRKVLKLTKHECSDKALRVAFSAMDDDGSGTLSWDEFTQFIKFCSTGAASADPNISPFQKESSPPARVPGLIGGMAAFLSEQRSSGELPTRTPSRRPGTLPGLPLARVPFCLNGRDTQDNCRLASSARPLGRSESDSSLLSSRTGQNWAKPGMAGTLPQLVEPSDDTPPKCVCFTPTGVTGCVVLKSEGDRAARKNLRKDAASQKQTWSGTLPSKTCGGYMLLKGAQALNKVEERLFEAGIDVRGNYHKLGRDKMTV
jgi:Ca2+-binding EF-hand superfamily protein